MRTGRAVCDAGRERAKMKRKFRMKVERVLLEDVVNETRIYFTVERRSNGVLIGKFLAAFSTQKVFPAEESRHHPASFHVQAPEYIYSPGAEEGRKKKKCLTSTRRNEELLLT